MENSIFKSKIRKSRKSQAQQVFIFMLAIFLAALILLFGYRMIGKFMGDVSKTALIEFQTKLEGGVRKMSTKFNSVEKLELQVPGDFDKVCIFEQGFASPSLTHVCGGEMMGDTDGDFPAEFDKDMTMCSLWPVNTKQENVFLSPFTDAISIKTTQIKIANNNGYLCVKPVANRIALRLEGRGNHTIVSKWAYN